MPDGLGPAIPHLETVFRDKYGSEERLGWGPRQRRALGYHTPDEWYEALISAQVGEDTTWLDVGCGHSLFPRNSVTAKRLSLRCRRLVGVDPSDNIAANRFVHEGVRMRIEEFQAEAAFDLITMRMAAEHIFDPRRAVIAIGRAAKPRATLVIYTVDRYALLSIAWSLIPNRLHWPVRRWIWGGEKRDTHPTAYRMNTRRTLAKLLEPAGFVERSFAHLADCRATARWRRAQILELRLWQVLDHLGLPYPERCILGVYERARPDHQELHPERFRGP